MSAKIHTIGDSTMADYDQSQPDQKGMYGWGQVFGDYFTNGMTVKNWGDRGESARSFYKKFWAQAKAEIKKGDYVLIQFGHNDQKSVTTDVYREYLSKFVNETRALGATPVLVTSICRKLFDGTKISRLGRIDNGKAKGVEEDDHTYDFPYNMKKVADSLQVKCLDLTTACKKFMEAWGPQGCKQFFPAGGSTHTNELGARVNAQLVAQLMYKANILKKYIAISKINLPKNDGKIVMAADSKTYYISPKGNDKNQGLDKSKPFATLAKAQSLVGPGDIVYIMPGTYHVKESDLMAPAHDKNYAVAYLLDKSGTAKCPISYIGLLDENGKRPVFDFSAIKVKARVTGFLLSAKYLRIKNIETIGIPVNVEKHTQSENFRISNGSYNILENIAAHDGMGIGFYLINRCAHNYLINCDAYNNYDSFSEGGKGGNSDGFGCHPGSLDSQDNVLIGCRAWYNSDDGYDLINAQASVKIIYCIAYKNGLGIVNGEEKKLADGNGFKCGGYGMGSKVRIKFEKAPLHIIANCVSANNKANGFYANHHLGGLSFSHCSAFRNGGANFNMTNRKDASETGNVNVNGYGHQIDHCLSFGSDAIKSSKHLTWVDGDKKDCTIKENSFTWNSNTKKWDNDTQLNKKTFKSLDPSSLIAPRDKEGFLPAFDFLQPNEPMNIGYDWSQYRQCANEYRK